MGNINLIQYVLYFGVSACISAIFMPQMYAIAKSVRAIDDPAESDRKIHTRKIPRLGGLAIYVSFLLGYTIFSNARPFPQMESVLIGSFLVVLMGIFDDISPVRSWKKLLVQIVAAAIFVYNGGFVISTFDFFIDINLGVFAPMFTILWIVTITNAINLSDGMDGLAGGLSFISLITMAIIGSIVYSLYGAEVVMITLILAGSIVGFLPYNLPPAKIFMGDSGSQFIGYMIGVLSVLGFKQAAFTSFLIPVAILAIPLFDTVFAFFRRLINRQAPGTADAGHVHHRVLHSTESQKKSLFWIYGLSLLFSLSAIVYSVSKPWGTVLSILSFITAEIFVEYFNVISTRYSPLLHLIARLAPGEQMNLNRRKRVLRSIRNKKLQESGVRNKEDEVGDDMPDEGA